MDVQVVLSKGPGSFGLTLEVPSGGSLPDTILCGRSVFVYDTISDKGLAQYIFATAYEYDPQCSKCIPMRAA